MFEYLITAAILYFATAAFCAFWDVVKDWCLKQISKFIESFTTFVKAGVNVIAYYYHRKQDGWYKEFVPAEKVKLEDCPKSVRDALCSHDEVLVQRY